MPQSDAIAHEPLNIGNRMTTSTCTEPDDVWGLYVPPDNWIAYYSGTKAECQTLAETLGLKDGDYAVEQ